MVRPRHNPRSRGERAEQLACAFLIRQGMRLLERNYRAAGGEIDLIMRHRDEVVFVEVRARRSAAYGSALESVAAAKRRHLVRAAKHYLGGRRGQVACRFDVIGLSGEPGRERIDWITDAFQV